ncbi:hypothetical protein BBJ28_00007638 [Nothophytophthora sp. Chile5]|nr:hypothetical protein BBJ28_00007638 [Nothophytophthora sp. Chile5]
MAARKLRSGVGKKVMAASNTQPRKPTAKATQHIQWRGKRITLFGEEGALKNPFAPEVPCHRVVAATLDIGGFQGSTGEASPCIQKKRTLLKKEGVAFTVDLKIEKSCLHQFD